ncbi:hypothetical protein K1719_040046 [Acacia pycnantha]|nr:hypothetical protein K1719_040046 [Acacia pycnantha]
MLKGSAGVSFSVVFFDGESTVNVGEVTVDSSMNFKNFQSDLGQKIGVSPHQLSVYSAKRLESLRTSYPCTSAALLRDEALMDLLELWIVNCACRVVEIVFGGSDPAHYKGKFGLFNLDEKEVSPMGGGICMNATNRIAKMGCLKVIDLMARKLYERLPLL